MITRYFDVYVFVVAAATLTTADRAQAHGLQILLDSDGAGGLQAEYAFGPHARVTGVQIGEAQLWDERVRHADNYPTVPIGGEERITWGDYDYLIQYAVAEWDNQLEWRLEPESSDFPGITPLRGAFEAIDAHYGDGRLDLRYNLQGPLQKWDAGAFTPATDASVSLTTQRWPVPDDGFWYAELDQRVTSTSGVVAAAPYDIAGEDFDGGEHWHYLWTLNGPDGAGGVVPAAEGVYLAEFTISSGDGELESDPLWVLLRQGLDANSPVYLAAEAAAIAAVPEPTTLAIIALGLTAVATRRRRA